ncbi:uncharacterized protein [Manis javanica]|uniref:uncharacterized protein n=1 Tax=Manis javanica TaxID=9974 RepID=UPI003C6DAAF5
MVHSLVAFSPRDGRQEARRRDSDRGSREEEPEVAAAGFDPSEGSAGGGSGRGRCQGVGAETEGRGLQNRTRSGTRTGRLGRSLICAEPSRTRAEHAAPACSARVHPSRRGGDRAETVAPGRCLGPDRLHVSPSRGHVHQLSPVRRPDVLRINKMKLGATEKQIAAPSPPNPCPRPRYLSAPVSPQPLRSAGARRASCSPGAPPPARAPIAGPGALCRSH